MKKNLLTFLFVVAFLCGSALVVSARNSSSPTNSVAVTKTLLVAKIKAKLLKARCEDETGCGSELRLLLGLNALYEERCASGGYSASCETELATYLIRAGELFEQCLDMRNVAKNIDGTIDRNKREKPRDVKSR